MLPSSTGLRSGVGRSRSPCLHQRSGLRTGRLVRQPRLGISAFKDWFNGLVQQQKDSPSQAQPASQTAVQEPPSAPPSQQLHSAPKPAPKRDFLEARQVSLFQLFDSSDYKFDIPTYQRPYAWRTKQIYELLQDFVKAYESRQEYFLGAVVATRAADGAHVPYQLIDGQQRLTSLVLLLAFLHGWAREQGNEVLEGRIRRMLYLDADPLEPGSSSRYRLRLRDADDGFFRQNVLDEFLPHQYRLTGLAAAAAEAAVDADGSGGNAAASASTDAAEDARPLENETWWRLYENASFLRGQLQKLVSEGLNLQDFTFHVLRNCFVVLMVARDEGASFRIFSTLNGRGMDLSVVDKLKADLLAGELSSAERAHFADAWGEMEAVLGRAAFHRVFDYMRELAAVRDPRVRETSVLEYFTRRVDDPAAVKQVLQVALDYSRLLLQLRQASWAPPELAALLSTAPPDHQQQLGSDSARSEAVSAVVHAVLFEQAAAATAPSPLLAPDEEDRLLGQLHEQHRQWQDGAAAAPSPSEAAVGAGAAVAVPEPEAVTATTTSVPLVQEEKDGAVLVFRFDDLPATAVVAVSATATATSAAFDDVGSDSLVLTAEEQQQQQQNEQGVAETRSDSEISSFTTLAALAALSEEVEDGVTKTNVTTAAPAAALALDAEEEGHLPSDVLEGAAGPQPSEDEGQVLALGRAVVEVAGAAFGGSGEAEQQQPRQQQAASYLPALALDITAATSKEEVPEHEQQQQRLETQVEPPAIAFQVETAAQEDSPPYEGERASLAALLAELDERSRYMNLFSDEAWLPPLLEFFYQTEDPEHRVSFMKGAEALQLLLELLGDPAAKAARWAQVSDALLQRPFRPEQVLAALRLTDNERVLFRARLDSKDLYGTADQRTLRHLLIRCEPPSVSRSLVSGLGGLIVERVVPQSAPEGSTWRKTRISSPCDPRSSWPDAWFCAAAAAEPERTATSAEQPSQVHDATTAAAGTAAPVSYEVKYWYEVQRLNWHGKLGNLVLLPATAANTATATADYDAKAALWRQAGVASRLPGFTGPLVDERGRYGRFKFCYDEARQRHIDMLEYLIAEFEL